MSWLWGWRPVLRLARRDAWRAKSRSVLVLVLVALPVLGATAAAVVLRTADVRGTEAIERRAGTADVVVSFVGGEVWQRADPNGGLAVGDAPRRDGKRFGPADVSKALGRPIRAITRVEAGVRVRTAAGVARVSGEELDLRDPLTRGLVHLLHGRFPADADEVAVNPLLVQRGAGLGGTLVLASGRSLTVVGIVEDASHREPQRVWAMPGELGLDPDTGGRSWFVDAGGPVRWKDVRRLNELGATALSQAVLAHPPSASELPPEVSSSSGLGESAAAVVALVVVMALLEVVLLAGPAFAVGARRQSRNLALFAACGATRKQLRRVVLASGLVLGLAGSALGVALGLLVATVTIPLAQRRSSSFFGPLDVPWWQLAGLALFGVVSAALAAVVPAVLASRQDVVAVLAGRRGDRRPDPRSPLLGLVLVGSGAAVSGAGATRSAQGEFVIAVGAVIAVVGMIFVVPLVLSCLAWAAGRLPLPLRYAVRDAARHRARTVPAVAAVAATVVGVVALGIAASSDAKEYRETYQPALPIGMGWVQPSDQGAVGDESWQQVTQTVARELPGNTRVVVSGLPAQTGGSPLSYEFEAGGQPVGVSYSNMLGASVLVSDTLPALGLGEPQGSRAAASRVLSQGGAVVFTSAPVRASSVTIHLARTPPEGGAAMTTASARVPALFVESDEPRVQGVVSRSVASRLGVTPTVTGLAVAGPISAAAGRDTEEAVGAILEDASFYVERGYSEDRGTALALLVLGAVGALLMLGGTLTVTFLSLSDARPDLATLAAVGASPASRRFVAASFAATVGFSGALLGAAIGVIPGYAVTYPLTDQSGWHLGRHSHFVDVPWLLVVGVVGLLPLLTSLVVGLTARSRLPAVTRIS